LIFSGKTAKQKYFHIDNLVATAISSSSNNVPPSGAAGGKRKRHLLFRLTPPKNTHCPLCPCRAWLSGPLRPFRV
jgi:hypothetical protein